MQQIFRTVGPYPQRMEQIIVGLLTGDDRFVRDAAGGWRAKPKGSRLLVDMLFSFAEFETWRISGRREIPVFFAFASCHHDNAGNVQVFSIEKRGNFTSDAKKAIRELGNSLEPVSALTVHAGKLLHALINSILVHPAPSQALSFLNFTFTPFVGSEFEIESISLTRLMRRLFPEVTIRGLADIANQLNIAYAEPMNLRKSIELQMDIFAHLLELLSQQDIRDFEALVAFIQEGEKWVDFSRYRFNVEYIRNLPELPGVYLMTDRAGAVFYVGKARNLRSRVASYFVERTQRDEKTRKIFNRLHDLTYERTGSELEALLMENQYIHCHQPVLNTQIEVHPLDLTRFRERKLILFTAAVDERQLTLFFIHGTMRAIRITADRQHIDAAAWEAKILRFFFQPSATENEFSPDQLEIIWRWLSLNEASVNVIDVDRTGGVSDCLACLQSYVNDPEVLRSKMEYR